MILLLLQLLERLPGPPTPNPVIRTHVENLQIQSMQLNIPQSHIDFSGTRQHFSEALANQESREAAMAQKFQDSSNQINHSIRQIELLYTVAVILSIIGLYKHPMDFPFFILLWVGASVVLRVYHFSDYLQQRSRLFAIMNQSMDFTKRYTNVLQSEISARNAAAASLFQHHPWVAFRERTRRFLCG